MFIFCVPNTSSNIKEEVIGAIVKYSISINDYVSGHDLDIKLLSMAMIIKSTTSSQVKFIVIYA